MTGEPSRHSVISTIVPHGITTNHPPVTAVLLLETLLTGIVFAGFWVSSTQQFPAMVPSMLVAKPVVTGPISGLGEQLLDGLGSFGD